MRQSSEARPAVDTTPYLRIEQSKGWTPVSFSELWQYRDLLSYLVLRDIRSITHSTRLGFFWILLQPLAFATILTIVMGFLVKVPTGGVPYAVVILSGLLPWNYVNSSIARSSSSMIANSYLLTKVYFPRLIIPIVPIVSGLVDFAIMFVVLIAAALYYEIVPQASWLFLAVPSLLAIALSIGAGLWFSAVTVRYRDVGNIVPVLLQLCTYASPVFYPVSLVPERWRWLYDLNPMVGIIETTRWALLGNMEFPATPLAISAGAVVVLVATGIFYFRSTEDFAADIL